jgi:hypothetical protein
MSYITELLHLSEVDVRNIADANAGYAAFIQRDISERAADSREPVETLLPWLASCWLMGGILKSLVSPEEALPLFRSAAQVYRQLKHPFWKVAAVCGLDKELLLTEELIPSQMVETTPNEYLYEQLRLSYLARTSSTTRKIPNTLEQQGITARTLRLRRAGRLNLPLQLYLEALENTSPITYKSVNDVGDPLRDLLYRAQESTELASADSYHWRHLRGSVVPIEPELLAVCINIVQTVPHQLDWLNEIQNSAYIPLLVALNIVQSNGEL